MIRGDAAEPTPVVEDVSTGPARETVATETGGAAGRVVTSRCRPPADRPTIHHRSRRQPADRRDIGGVGHRSAGVTARRSATRVVPIAVTTAPRPSQTVPDGVRGRH